MVELLGLPYSPWSEKARWALEARQVPYKSVRYSPLLGEPGLRIKLRKWTGPVSVPVLIDEDGRAIADSAAIAEWANARGTGPDLFPRNHVGAIARYIEEGERGLGAGRARSLRRLLGDDAGLVEMVPKGIVRTIGRGAAVRVSRAGVKRTLGKYGGAAHTDEAHERTIVDILDGLRGTLAEAGPRTGPPTLLDEFSFADIAMTQVLAFIEPPTFGLRIGDAARRSFTDPDLRTRYADLLGWRDAIYTAYRPQLPRS